MATFDSWMSLIVERRFAIVTLITGSDDYLLGAIVLGRSLQIQLNATASDPHRRRSKYASIDLVCMVTPDVSAEVRDLLHDVGGFQIVNVAAIGNPTHTNPRFVNVYTKLNAWKLTTYEHVLLLDADTLAVGRLDELLDMRIGGRNIAAANDCCDKFNSGVILLKPSLTTFGQMSKHIVDYKSYDGGDQGFLNKFFPNWRKIKYEFNAQLPDYIALPTAWDDVDLKIIHYEKVKPWSKYPPALNAIMKRWQSYLDGVTDAQRQSINEALSRRN